MKRKSVFVHGQDVEACLRNASFWCERAEGRWAWYANGDFMGLREHLPEGCQSVSDAEIRYFLPRPYWRCTK